MSKDSFWFPHDSNARHDPKIVAMLSDFGMTGYGYYWVIIEILREQKDYSIDLNKEYVLHAIAKETGSEVAQIKAFIQTCVTFDLFNLDENNILSCSSLLFRLKKFTELKEKRSHSAKKRWNKLTLIPTEKKEESLFDEDIDNKNQTSTTKKKKNIVFEKTHEFFKNDDFNSWWNEWEDFRKKIRKPLSDGARKTNFDSLIKITSGDLTKAIETMKVVIKKGWQGIYAPDQDNFQTKEESSGPVKIRP